MATKYIAPESNLTAFTCSYCGVLAEQKIEAYYLVNNGHYVLYGTASAPYEMASYRLTINTCQNCKAIHIWLEDNLIYPKISNVPMPIEGMPEIVENIYNEARDVFSTSPKAAAALLRLALQHLCKELGGDGNNINNDIKKLVSEGLDPRVQKALDAVRVIGNNAVHPGELNLHDDKGVASSLFELINFIVNQMIVFPNEIDDVFDKLPDSTKKAIENRDK